MNSAATILNPGGMAGTPWNSMPEEDDAAALILDERGMIRGCNGASERLFGYRRNEVVWRHVSMLLPQLANVELLQNGRINPRLRFLCRIGGYFHALNRNGERFASDLFLLDLYNPGSSSGPSGAVARNLRMIVRRDQPKING